jgi:GT2 family glycosyltransferase
LPPKIAVLIVTHNSAEPLAGALAALREQDIAHEVHVWDNASRDRTAEIVAEFPEAHFHPSAVNLGFSAGNNRLLQITDSEYVLFLNPDAKPSAKCLGILYKKLAEKPLFFAASGPKLHKPELKIIDSAGIDPGRKTLSPHDRGEGETDRGQYDEPGENFGPSFACTLWRRSAIEAVTLDGEFLDEDFFAYFEDVDVAWRAGRLGQRFWYEPSATCEHRRGRPENHGTTLAARAFVNRWLVWIANEDGAAGWSYLFWRVPYELARLLWKSVELQGFSVAWRIFRVSLPRALQKRRRLASMKA